MKNKHLKQLMIIPVIIWMAVVFKFSNEPAKISDNTSLNLTKKMVEIVSSEENVKKEKKQIREIKNIDPIIRKIAHFTLFAIGGFFIMTYVNGYEIEDKKKILYNTLAGTIYAITDEIHQIFVPGRSAQISDVILDSMGVVTGACFCLIIIKIFQNIKTKQIKHRAK